MQTATVQVQARDVLDRLFERLTCLGLGRHDVPVALHVVAELPGMEQTLARTTHVQSRGQVDYYADGQGFYVVTAGGSVVQTDCIGQHVVAHVTAAVLNDPDLLDNVLWSAVAPLVRRRGFFPLHAFAAAWRDQGVLVVGKTGSGKTTTGLALVRSGWRFLSDDGPFLQKRETAVVILGSHVPANVTATTAGFFPELQPIFAGSVDKHKRSFAIGQTYGAVLKESAPATLVLFPSVTGDGECSTTRVAPAMALAGLIGQGIDGWDKEAMPAHFALLAALADQAPAYRLRLGRDVARLPDLIHDLLPQR